MQFLSQELMSSYDQRQERVRAAISRFERFPGDTGSSEVQGSSLFLNRPDPGLQVLHNAHSKALGLNIHIAVSMLCDRMMFC